MSFFAIVSLDYFTKKWFSFAISSRQNVYSMPIAPDDNVILL